MSWVAVAVGGGALVGGLLQSEASGDAADQQSNAAANANATQRYQYDTTRADYAPYREAGAGAIGQIRNLLGMGAFGPPANAGAAMGFGVAAPTNRGAASGGMNALMQDPGYQFGLQQGQQALDRRASARGGMYSGAQMKAASRFNSDYAGTKLDQSFNRLASLAQLGATGTAGTANAGANMANQISANQIGLGNALGANSLNQGNIWGNAFNTVGAYGSQNLYGSGSEQDYLRSLFGG